MKPLRVKKFNSFLPENIRNRVKRVFKKLVKRKNNEINLHQHNTILKNTEGKLIGKRRVERALWMSEEKYRLMVENLEDYAIFMIDKDGNIVSWNKGAERIKGYREDEVIGKHFSCFYTEKDIKENLPEKTLKIAMKDGKYKNEGWQIRKNGELFWAQVVITALRDKNGVLQGFVNVTKDLTDRKIMEEEIMKAYERVKNALEKEMEFKRKTAHYFFNPIAIAKGYLLLALEEGDEKEKIKKAIAAINRVEKVIKNITERGEIIE